MSIKELIDLFLEKIQTFKLEVHHLKEEIIKYNKVIDDLNNKKISKEAINLLYEKYRLCLTNKNYKTYLPTIKADLFVLTERLKIFESKLEKSKLVYKTLKFRQIFPSDLLEFINEELTLDGYNDVFIIKLNEKIKIYNSHQVVKKTNAIQSQDLYLISNLLDHGFFDYQVKNPLVNEDKLSKFASNYIKLYQNNALGVADEVLNNDFTHYSDEEKEHIYLHMLDNCQDQILYLNEIVKEKDFYFDIVVLQDIKNEYKKNYAIFEHIKNKYEAFLNKKSEVQLEEKIESEIVQEDILDFDVNKLYYSTYSIDPSKCCFMRDISSFRKEGLSDVLMMLEAFKKDNLKYLKVISNGFLELKKDQIRIILKPLGNNNYSVMGSFIKKADNIMSAYASMYERPVAQIDDEYSLEVEMAYETFIMENARKNTR